MTSGRIKMRRVAFIGILCFVALVGTCIVGVVALYFLAGGNPRIDVSAAIENDQVVFSLPHSGVRGILTFMVKEGDKTLWELQTGYEKGSRIVYGTLPMGGNVVARQRFPPAGIPLKEIRGRTITVIVTYQYDDHWVPSSGMLTKELRIP